MYPSYKPEKPLFFKKRNPQISWQLTGKNKNTYLDQVQKDAKKYVPPNHYFKTGKGEQVTEKMNCQDAKFSTKRFQFSVEPKKTFVDTLFADGKKKQVGPTTYKNLDP